MTTVFKDGYKFTEFFEASGNWTAPLYCTEAVIIGSGGGGGGGGGGAVKIAAGSGVQPGGSTGSTGGTTTFIGAEVSISFPGGAGGAGGSSIPAPATNTAAPGGLSGAGGGSGGGGGNGLQGIANSTTLNLETQKFRNTDYCFAGGIGGMGGYWLAPGSPGNTVQNRTPGQPGALLNGGAGGANGTDGNTFASGTLTATVPNGGHGGWSGGIRKKVDIIAGAVYAITIGAGGAGGTGANNGPNSPSPTSSNNRSGGGGGGGGAGGFVIVAWNE